MSEYTTMKITYTIHAQANDARFSIPKPICELLDVTDGDYVRVRVRSKNYTTHTKQKLRSGMEIYGDIFRKVISPSDKLRVTVSRVKNEQRRR